MLKNNKKTDEECNYTKLWERIWFILYLNSESQNNDLVHLYGLLSSLKSQIQFVLPRTSITFATSEVAPLRHLQFAWNMGRLVKRLEIIPSQQLITVKGNRREKYDEIQQTKKNTATKQISITQISFQVKQKGKNVSRKSC